MAYLQYSTILPAQCSEVWGLLQNYQCLPKLLPKDFSLEPVRMARRMQNGAEYEFKLGRLGIDKFLWVVRIEDYHEGQEFTERLVMGPFESWSNVYKLEDHGDRLSKMTNLIEYKMAFGLLGRLADDLFIRRDLRRLVEQAHDNLRLLLVKDQSG